MTVGIYCRLSREDEGAGESESIRNQRALLLQYAGEQGWSVFDIYVDEDYSGADRDRPEFNRLIHDAEMGKVDIILVKTQSRFTRDMELLERYVHGLFPLWGVRFVALVDHVDTAQKGGKKARQISGLVNEWYLEDLSESIRAVLDHKRRAGDYIGSFALYGYVKSETDRHRLEIDPVAAQVVRRIFSLYLQGMGKGAIAKKLDGDGIPNPTAYKRQNGMDYVNGRQRGDDGRWNRTTVGRILREPMYTGDMVQGRRRKASYKSKALVPVEPEDWMVVPGTHQAIIDRETFDRVQALLEERTRSGGRGEVHPLAGLARCALCGSPLTKVTTTYRGVRRRYLRCPGRAKGNCAGVSVNLADLEGEVLAGIREQIAQYGDMVYIRKELARDRAAEDRQSARGDRLEREIARLERAMRTLYLDRADGTVSRAQYLELSGAYAGELEEKKTRLAALEGESRCGDEVDIISDALEPDTLTRALAVQFVRAVTVGEKVEGVQVVTVEWLT